MSRNIRVSRHVRCVQTPDHCGWCRLKSPRTSKWFLGASVLNSPNKARKVHVLSSSSGSLYTL